jgi:hypothetical protein
MVDVIHICVAMKPIEGGFAQNALKYGVAGINVDGCRIGAESIATRHTERPCGDAVVGRGAKGTGETSYHSGRWPANIIFQHHSKCVGDCPARKLDEQSDSGSASRFFKMVSDNE